MPLRNIEWKFLPPISLGNIDQTKKTCIKKFYEDVLKTILVEVESTLNSRLLTSISNDYNDLQVLTSNHFLTVKLTKYFSSNKFSQSDINSRKCWKSIQALANMFWARFIKVYLPALQEEKM